MNKLLAVSLVCLLAAPAGLLAAPPTRDEVATLVKQLKDKDAGKRSKAARALENLDPGAKDAVPILLEALKEQQDVTIPPVASRALARLGAPAVPALIEALEGKDGHVQQYAAMAVQKIGPQAKQAVPALIEIVKKYKAPNTPAKLQAIEALGRIGRGAKEAVPVLNEALKAKPPRAACRISAAVALGRIGPDAKDAVPTLIDILGEEETKSGPLRYHAATALGHIGASANAEVVPALVALLENKKLGPARNVAANALGQIGPDAKNAVSALRKATEEAELKDNASRALERIQGKK
jgi:HEAT repeat protein